MRNDHDPDEPPCRPSGDFGNTAPASELLPEGFAAHLEEFSELDSDFLWITDERVFFEGDWESFYDGFDGCDADLLATVIRSRDEEPDWPWWSSLRDPAGNEVGGGVAAMLPLVRLSQAAAAVILVGLREGWTGHPEAVVPTLASKAGLKIEDIGGIGSFTPPERIVRWYEPRTWNALGPVEHVPGKLHYPVPLYERCMAPKRLAAVQVGKPFRLLFATPAGQAAAPMIHETLKRFHSAGADCMVLQYDNHDLGLPSATRVVRDQGHKWQLALRHLTPETVGGYDFVFFWDDDLDAAGFDPVRFVRIMLANRLEMAQPAIESPHGLSHPITARSPLPPPWRFKNPDELFPVVGRLTNFVEIMAPVFTRPAWIEFHGYLTADNRSGWGYDYIPLGRKGIVDALPVTHTRPVRSINRAAEDELARFLGQQALFRHAVVEQGWLFEPPAG